MAYSQKNVVVIYSRAANGTVHANVVTVPSTGTATNSHSSQAEDGSVPGAFAKLKDTVEAAMSGGNSLVDKHDDIFLDDNAFETASGVSGQAKVAYTNRNIVVIYSRTANGDVHSNVVTVPLTGTASLAHASTTEASAWPDPGGAMEARKQAVYASIGATVGPANSTDKDHNLPIAAEVYIPSNAFAG